MPGPERGITTAITNGRWGIVFFDVLLSVACTAKRPAQHRDGYDATWLTADPRVRCLVEARWRLANGGSSADWHALGDDNLAALVGRGSSLVRAAAAAAILPPAERS